jgi:hypothetical protein
MRLSTVRDEFDLSTSNNWRAPSLPILLSVLSENGIKNKYVTEEIEICDGRI